MLFDLTKPNVRVSAAWRNEIVLRIISKNLLEEDPVRISGEEGTLAGTFSDVDHPSAPETAQVCLYQLPQEDKRYSFVGWDPESNVHNGFGIVVEKKDGDWSVSILSEDDMGLGVDDHEDLHEGILDDVENYGTDGYEPAYSQASIVAEFP